MRFLDLALDDVAAEIEVGLEGLRRLEALRGREVYPILSSLFLARRCDAPLRLQMRTINTLSFRSDPKCLSHVNPPQPTAPTPCSARGVADVVWGAPPADGVCVFNEICHSPRSTRRFLRAAVGSRRLFAMGGLFDSSGKHGHL